MKAYNYNLPFQKSKNPVSYEQLQVLLKHNIELNVSSSQVMKRLSKSEYYKILNKAENGIKITLS